MPLGSIGGHVPGQGSLLALFQLKMSRSDEPLSDHWSSIWLKVSHQCLQYCCCLVTVGSTENTFIEPRGEETGLRGFRPGLTQTDLYSH